MIDIESCIKQWYEEETVSECMEALLLAIEDECCSVNNTISVGIERLLADLNIDSRQSFERVKARSQRAAYMTGWLLDADDLLHRVVVGRERTGLIPMPEVSQQTKAHSDADHHAHNELPHRRFPLNLKKLDYSSFQDLRDICAANRFASFVKKRGW